MSRRVDTESNQHQGNDDQDKPLPQSSRNDGVDHLNASLDRVLLALIVQVESAVGDDVFFLPDATEHNATIVLLISQRNLPQRIGQGTALHKHVILVFFSYDGGVGHRELVIRVAGSTMGETKASCPLIVCCMSAGMRTWTSIFFCSWPASSSGTLATIHTLERSAIVEAGSDGCTTCPTVISRFSTVPLLGATMG